MFKSSSRLVFAMLSLTIMAAAVYGFAAANTVPTSKAGDGAGVVSGYTVSSIHYNLNAANPQSIDSVTFNLDTAPVAGSTIKIRLDNTGSTWYTCTNVATAVTCNNGGTLGASVTTANELRVVVAD